MSYRVILGIDGLDLGIVHAWLARTYWSPRIRRAVVEEAFRNSLVAAAYAGDAPVGVARAVTDYATFAWLCDVYVHEDHRGKGLATQMIHALEAHPRLGTLRRWALGTRDAHAVYVKLGYEPAPVGRFMIKSPAGNWQE